MSIICPYCLSELHERAAACPHCGGVFAGRNPAGSLPVALLFARALDALPAAAQGGWIWVNRPALQEAGPAEYILS